MKRSVCCDLLGQLGGSLAMLVLQLARRTLNQMQESDAELRNRDSTVQALQGAVSTINCYSLATA